MTSWLASRIDMSQQSSSSPPTIQFSSNEGLLQKPNLKYTPCTRELGVSLLDMAVLPLGNALRNRRIPLPLVTNQLTRSLSPGHDIPMAHRLVPARQDLE